MNDFQFHLDRTREQFRWGPLDGTLITLHFPVFGLLISMTQAYGKQLWPDGALLCSKRRFMWLQDNKELYQHSFEAFKSFMLPDAERTQVRASYNSCVAELRQDAQRAYADGCADLSDADLLHWFAEWTKRFHQFWAHAGLPELATWGAAADIERQLQDHGLSGTDFIMAREALTVPEDMSFFQKAERALLNTIVTGQPLDAYRDRWYWIHNSYARVHRCTREEIEKEAEDLRSHGDLQHQLNDLHAYVEKLREKKSAVQKQFGLPDTLLHESRALGICIAWQDERKGESWRQFDVLFVFLRECERRFGLPLAESAWMTPNEVVSFCRSPRSGNDVTKFIQARQRASVLGVAVDAQTILVGEEAQSYIDAFWEVVPDQSGALKGVVASFGHGGSTGPSTISGTARLIASPTEASKFQDGEILVTAMTTPDFMPILRKATAVVTDEGGLTAHAAVVSRELGIPCIVGVKTATRRISTGQTIALNLNDGTITIES
jgi:phosphohistidine swiveling domain-containing protein